jgi:NAD(P)-dependent dehydrogenase (short-subunit alcohol dehydrogenase family)
MQAPRPGRDRAHRCDRSRGRVTPRSRRVTSETGLDGLVNNAGIGLASPVELLPLEVFRRQLEINVTGQFAVTQAFLTVLPRARGRIVFISTIGVRFRPPFAGALCGARRTVALPRSPPPRSSRR